MSDALPYFIMDNITAARWREETRGDSDRIEPREIFVGPYKGRFAVAERNRDNPAFADRRDAFAMLGNAVALASEVFTDPNAPVEEE